MGLRDRLLYAALAGALGGVLGVVAFVRVLRGTQGADPGAMVWHWALWSAVVFGLLGLLRGARAADLAVEQPRDIELVINARVARALGLALPAELQLRADRWIE